MVSLYRIIQENKKEILKLALGAVIFVCIIGGIYFYEYRNKALHRAVEEKNYEDVLLCIQRGADVNRKRYAGLTPLILTTTRSSKGEPSVEIAELLIKNGADVLLRTDDGMTALHYAAMWNSPELAELFINNGLSVHVKDDKGQTPLFYSYSSEVVSIFIKQGADVNVKDSMGETPLFSAFSNPEVVRILIEQGADVNVRNNEGETPLIHLGDYSAFNYNTESGKILIEAGADINAKDNNGRTTLLNAARNGNNGGKIELVKLLLQYGADPNEDDSKGFESFILRKDLKEILNKDKL